MYFFTMQLLYFSGGKLLREVVVVDRAGNLRPRRHQEGAAPSARRWSRQEPFR
jgi:hypothetical protein